MPTEQRKDLRTRMRRLRRAVSPDDSTRAARELSSRLSACDFFETAQLIAAYFPTDGEIDTRPVIQLAWSEGKSIFLPIVQENGRLGFAPLTESTRLESNRYGIPEPVHATTDLLPPAELDLVLVPLVAFDDELFRLGMGGGYYDKTFEFVEKARAGRPLLVGTGYEFQRVETVLPEKWDVPTWRIVTDKAIHEKVCKK